MVAEGSFTGNDRIMTHRVVTNVSVNTAYTLRPTIIADDSTQVEPCIIP